MDVETAGLSKEAGLKMTLFYCNYGLLFLIFSERCCSFHKQVFSHIRSIGIYFRPAVSLLSYSYKYKGTLKTAFFTISEEFPYLTLGICPSSG